MCRLCMDLLSAQYPDQMEVCYMFPVTWVIQVCVIYVYICVCLSISLWISTYLYILECVCACVFESFLIAEEGFHMFYVCMYDVMYVC